MPPRRQVGAPIPLSSSDDSSDDDDSPPPPATKRAQQPSDRSPSGARQEGAGPSSAGGVDLTGAADGEEVCRRLAASSVNASDLRRRVHIALASRFPSRLLTTFPLDLEVVASLPEVYDAAFFGGTLLPAMRRKNCSLSVCYNDKCTKVGGRCSVDGLSQNSSMS